MVVILVSLYSFPMELHLAKSHRTSFCFPHQIYVLLGILGRNRGVLVSMEE
jgi:hypothetical protein